MKIDVQTPAFCPDNCPAAELERLDLLSMDGKVRMWTCKNENVCMNAYEIAEAYYDKS